MPRSYAQICPIARALDIVGERWTMLLVRDMFLGYTRFTDFQRESPGIPARVLSDRLKKLEAEGIVERAIYSEHPLRAEYRLTELGMSLRPVMEAMFRWGAEHRLTERQRTAVYRRLFGDGVPADTPTAELSLPAIAR